jgi:methylsterol monooxygenase
METQWVAESWQWLFEGRNEWLVASLGGFILHEVQYFGFHLPWLAADFIPAFHKYKLQPTKANTWPLNWRCIKRLLFNHFIIELPLILLAHPIFCWLGIHTDYHLLPSWTKIGLTIIACFLIEDFYFYWIHRLLHWGPFYTHIHKIHHHHTAPFGIAAEYAHPVETIFLGFGTVLGPFLFADHLFTVWAWLTVRLFQTVEAHAGYDFPWSPRHFIPGWGGAEFHDYHHMNFNGNYASTFIWCDWLFGTDKKYRAYKATGVYVPSKLAAQEKEKEKEVVQECLKVESSDKVKSTADKSTALCLPSPLHQRKISN